MDCIAVRATFVAAAVPSLPGSGLVVLGVRLAVQGTCSILQRAHTAP